MDAAEQKLEVIRKLLAKAERAATTDEADAYNVKAAELMARHGVDTAMLASSSSGDVRDAIDSKRLRMTDPYSAEKAQLANGVARALGCRLVQHPGFRRGQIDAVTVMGFGSDLRRVELVYTSLLLQATRSVVRQRPPGWSGESTAAFRRTYLVGFTNEVYRRLVDAERGAVRQHDAKSGPTGPSAALVVADRQSVVDRAYGEEYGHLKAGRRRQLSGSGYGAGQEAGRRADVGQGRVANTRRALERG
ncbi:MAG: DUF2786 domain-containing protein [Cryobacterium sp.]|nr:DUF2786 domain-containing protein [Cryobacterium sp.]